MRKLSLSPNLEGEVLLAATVVGLGPVGVEVDGQRLAAFNIIKPFLRHHRINKLERFSMNTFSGKIFAGETMFLLPN